MTFELVAIAAALCIAVVIGVARSTSKWRLAAIPIAVGAVVAVFLFAPATPPSVAPVRGQPLKAPRDDYVGSDACRSCHEDQHRTWDASYHSKMTQEANETTILAKWEGEIPAGRMTAKLLRKGDEYWVETPHLRAFMHDNDQIENAKTLPKIQRRIVLVTGSHHKQMYWYATGEARQLDLFPFLWLVDDKRWVPRDAAFLRPNFWPPRIETGNWNYACIQCHATGGRPRFADEHGGSPDTDVVDFGIACEACHGPGGPHQRSLSNPVNRVLTHLGLRDVDDIVNPSELAPERAVEVCGQCHGQAIFAKDDGYWSYSQSGTAYKPGDRLADTMHVIDPREARDTPRMKRYLKVNQRGVVDSFWSDGMIMVGGRELNAMLLAPCHDKPESDKKLTCTHCHALHQDADDARPTAKWTDDQLGPGMRGDKACTQCHAKSDKGLDYRSEGHTHHEADSSGSRCLNCHMPHATYTLLKATRNHMISSPNATRAASTGRPDACSLCHLDKPLGWTADHLHTWYGQVRPKLGDDLEKVPAGINWGLSGNALQRAIIAWHMGWQPANRASGTDWLPLVLAQRVVDPYASVRHIAGRVLHGLKGFEEMPYDYVGKIDNLNLTAAAVFAKWKRAMKEAGRTTTDLLYKGRFELTADVFDRLVKSRDDAFMDLPE